MTNQPSFGQPTKLLVVDIRKRKLLEEEAIFFEMDILVHMMRAMSIEKIKEST